MTIGTESCYLQKLDLDKVIWDLEMVAAKAVLFDRHQFEVQNMVGKPKAQ